MEKNIFQDFYSTTSRNEQKGGRISSWDYSSEKFELEKVFVSENVKLLLEGTFWNIWKTFW
jgi:hypothetical protein